MAGRLKYLLKPVQKIIYETIKASKELIYVVNCSRRLGKTTTMAVIAIETAIQTKHAHVHFGAPYQNALRDFLLPIFNQLLLECPDDLRPTWKAQESKWVFPNGSFIKLCGSNNGQFENLRGNKSDLFIIDEAAQIDELDSVVKDVALPQLLSSKNPNKRIILPSTPPNTPDHPFKKYAEKAQARGAYSHFTIFDGWYSKEEIDRFAEEVGGKDSTTFRREFLGEFVTDSTLQIVPEWNSTEFVKEVPKDDYFQFYYLLEGMDVGYRDFTAWILGYYDWQNARLVIEHEVALRENEFTTKKFDELITIPEEAYFEIKADRKKLRRIADCNNLNFIADLARTYKKPFAPVSKKNGKAWMVNQLRQFIKSGKLVVHPRCKMLIASLEFGIWKKNMEEFDHSADLGHYDFIDAIVYLVSVLLPVIQNINPIPPLYKINVSTTMFPGGIPRHTSTPSDEIVAKMFPNPFNGQK